MSSPPPELSIIVPILNEAETLPALFANLARQTNIHFELLLCDGGSADGSGGLAAQLAATVPFPCRLLTTDKGRGRQLNAGAQVAVAPLLLFLHADSEFPDPQALRLGVDALLAAQLRRGDERTAGHFALRFSLPAARYRFGYFLAEGKARLDLPGCTHGDQGFLLSRNFFQLVGPFDQSLPVLEDTHFAEEIRRCGGWLLLPVEIATSARRFEREGFLQRQLLNALLMNFAAIGWEDFFRAAPDVYRSQDSALRLRIAPFISLIHTLLKELPRRRRWALWYNTGRYVRGNAWQLYFAWRARQAFRQGKGPGEVESTSVLAFRRWFDHLTDNPLGRGIAAVLVWCWFQGIKAWGREA